jgi:hypothetical protein
MADKEIEVVETTAGQITDVLDRLGVAKDRMVTVMIEPDDWLTKARQESRRLVIAAGLGDDDIDRLIDRAWGEVERSKTDPGRRQGGRPGLMARAEGTG